tara:strand:- start:4467 stop:7304 length:2838 start_codon:yes stop_codon:yes gene_type:complete
MKNKNKKSNTYLNDIIVVGAKDNNLNNINISIPRNKLITITGLSGSGKSTLAFDTIYSEGQRRYVESLSTYARQFLGGVKKPKVDHIYGLSPAISIQQKSVSKNPRSTVGTITEIYDYLRLLYARIGHQKCYKCNGVIEKQTVQQIVDTILNLKSKTKILILAPIIKSKKGQHKDVFKMIAQQGFTRVQVNNEVKDVNDQITLNKNKKHNIDVLVDRLIISKNISQRLTESVELALKIGDGILTVKNLNGEEYLFSENKYCPKCELSFEEIQPQNFSFNSPTGACSHCNGLGTLVSMDPKKIIPDINKNFLEGCIEPLGPQPSSDSYQGNVLKSLFHDHQLSFSTPWKLIPKQVRSFILYGNSSETPEIKKYKISTNIYFEGIINNLERRYKQTKSNYIRDWIEKYMSKNDCIQCSGNRLNHISLAVCINDVNIIELTKMTIYDINQFLSSLSLSKKEETISSQIIKEVGSRINFLLDVGLDYLTLHRSANTLSGGESQRIRLATQIGTQLMGVIYILDEPSIGLHQRDNQRLINTLLKLRDLGNTVIVVEHDSEIMYASDWIIDLGPKAGVNGGDIVYEGSPKDLPKAENSLTADYLLNKKNISIKKTRRKGTGHSINLYGAKGNNLKNINCEFPLGKLMCITGVSGSGKSSLINQTLLPILTHELYSSKATPLSYDNIQGVEHLDKVISIDQSPIGKTPRSNPATYTGLFTHIRNLFSDLPESKIRGYQPGRFSFNVKGGRCEDCQGVGLIKVEMHFMPDTYIQCESCKGKRFNRETLQIFYKNKNIYDILSLSIDEAADFFINHKVISRYLAMLIKVGLGYIKLGQRATTLSGGESQRIKLSTELSKIGTGKTLYVLDEPTTGLHFHDINILLKVLNELVDRGNSMIIIEHNMDIIKSSDWIIDLGLEGGDKGGNILFQGSPEEIIKIKNSYTGIFLKKLFD